MISESTIEQHIENINADVDSAIMYFVEKEKDFSSFLLGDDFHLLTEEEKHTLLFIHLVLHKSLEDNETPFDVERFQAKEENNWTLIDDKSKSWEEKVNQLFEGFAEEDLLAFTEDMLADDEISQLAKELIFVTAKSYIESKAIQDV